MFKLTLLACLLAPLICCAKAGEYHTSENGDFYYVERDWVTWEDALVECSYRNMTVFTPDTEKKQLEISELMSSLNMVYLWTAGLEIENLQFMWSTTGKNLTYSYWQEGEPMRSGNESDPQCIGINMNEWVSYKCIDLKPFICEDNHFIEEKNLRWEALKANQSGTNNQLEPPFSNDSREVNKAIKILDCDKHIITELEVLLKSHEKQRENLWNEKQREISDLKKENKQYLQQLSSAKAQLELKSKEIEMVKVFNEIQLQLESLNVCCDSSKNQTSTN